MIHIVYNLVIKISENYKSSCNAQLKFINNQSRLTKSSLLFYTLLHQPNSAMSIPQPKPQERKSFLQRMDFLLLGEYVVTTVTFLSAPKVRFQPHSTTSQISAD